MCCKDFLEELGAYLDGESAAALRAELERHMRNCDRCFVLLDTCRKTIAIYRGQEPVELPAALHGKVMRALARKGAFDAR